MQGYQIHANALAACCCLVSACADGQLVHSSADGAPPGVSGRPGHAKHFRSYPLSHQRKRR
jgi:hypothetical protein